MRIHALLIAAFAGICSCKESDSSVAGSTIPKDEPNRERLTPRNEPSGHSAAVVAVLNRNPGDLSASISALSDTDLLRILEATDASRNSSQHRLPFTLAAAELARRDPTAVMSWFNPENMIRGEAGWVTVAGILAEANPLILQEWLLVDLPNASPEVQGECFALGIMTLSSADPAGALVFSEKLPTGSLSNSDIITAVFSKFGELAPFEAEAVALAKYSGADLDLAFYNIAGGAGEVDQVLGVEFALKIQNSSDRAAALAVTFSQWLEADPISASKNLKTLDRRDLQASLQVFPGGPGSLVTKLAKVDPELLSGLLGTMVASKSNEGVFQAAIDSLTVTNPKHAAALIESMPDGDMKVKMVGTQFRAMASADPSAALSEASKISDGNLRGEAYRKIGEVVGSKGLDAATRLVDSLPAADRSVFMAAAIPYIAHQDPKGAAAFFGTGSETTIETGQKRELLAHLGMRLGETDATYAQAWLGKLPPDDQPYAMKGFATEMAKNDIEGLSVLLTTLPQDARWESGVKVLIENIKDSDPEMAAQWRSSLDRAGYK